MDPEQKGIFLDMENKRRAGIRKMKFAELSEEKKADVRIKDAMWKKLKRMAAVASAADSQEGSQESSQEEETEEDSQNTSTISSSSISSTASSAFKTPQHKGKIIKKEEGGQSLIKNRAARSPNGFSNLDRAAIERRSSSDRGRSRTFRLPCAIAAR